MYINLSLIVLSLQIPDKDTVANYVEGLFNNEKGSKGERGALRCCNNMQL